MKTILAAALALLVTSLAAPDPGVAQSSGLPWTSTAEAVEDFAIFQIPQVQATPGAPPYLVWSVARNAEAARVRPQEIAGPLFLVPGGRMLHARKGPTGRPLSVFGLDQGTILRGPTTGWLRPRATIRACPTCAGTERLLAFNRFPGPFLSAQLDRILYFTGGDLWLADVDWNGETVENPRQVTQLGVFTEESGRFILWYRNQVFLEGGFSQENPIVRVDLTTGEVEELPRMDVFVAVPPGRPGAGSATFATPSGRYVCASLVELLACYDIAEARRFLIPLAPVLDAIQGSRQARLEGALFPGRAGSDHGHNVLWLDEERGVSWTRGVLAIVDFAEGTARAVYTPEVGTRPGLMGISPSVRLLPGRRHVFVEVVTTEDGLGKAFRRISLDDGSAVDLDEIPSWNGQALRDVFWLDEDRFVYARREGGLTQRGTWLRDLASGEERRICPEPVVVDHPETGSWGFNIPAYFPRHEALYFASAQVGRGIWYAELAGGSCESVGDSVEGGQFPNVYRIEALDPESAGIARALETVPGGAGRG